MDEFDYEHELYVIRETEFGLLSNPAFATAFATWKSWGNTGDWAVFLYNFCEWGDNKPLDREELTWERYISEQSHIRDVVGHSVYLDPDLVY